MSWKSFDYICTNQECEEKDIKKELLVKTTLQNEQICDKCKAILTKLFGVGGIKTADNNGRMKI